FFFSRKRRHSRFSRDWSSDVCSSDLGGTWTATFDENGKAIGILSTNNYSFDLTGQVSENGKITAQYKNETTEVGTMTGTMTATSASGTWKSPLLNIEGVWEGSKN